MPNCAQISANLALAACQNSAVGLESELVLINRDDIDFAGSTVTGNVISALVLKSGKTGFLYTSEKNAFEGDSPLNKGTYKTGFNHQLVLRAFLKAQLTKDQINALAKTKVVAVVKNKDNVSGETKFEVYGWENGLELNDLSAPTTDGDGVIYTITLGTGENQRESELPKSFYTTSVTATETAFEALYTPSNNG